MMPGKKMDKRSEVILVVLVFLALNSILLMVWLWTQSAFWRLFAELTGIILLFAMAVYLTIAFWQNHVKKSKEKS